LVKVVIWDSTFFDPDGSPRIGGVQTYVLELARVFQAAGGAARIAASGRRAGSMEIGGVRVEALRPDDWKAGVAGGWARRLGLDDPGCIQIAANAHGAPRRLGPRSIGIQHGIYWDRPAASTPRLSKIAPRAVNLFRSWRGASAVHRFSRLVCVDLAFPTMAACIHSPLPWERIHYIPNFAPEPSTPPEITSSIRRIVFCRRFERHRGTRLFAQAVRPLLGEGWDGEIHLVGSGPDEDYLRRAFAGLARVRFYRLPFERRMEAYSEDSLVVIPSLSTEGTSLACIEAWSRGALVLASCVGGLANLIVHGHNGLLARPLASDFRVELERVARCAVDIACLKRNGLETFRRAFARSLWEQRWQQLLGEMEEMEETNHQPRGAMKHV